MGGASRWTRALVIVVVAAVGGLLALSLPGSSGHALRIDRQTFHGAWPFRVRSGSLRCKYGGAVFFTSATDGTVYALNREAVVYGGLRASRYNVIWNGRPLGDVLDAGLRLCKG
jgi:hypothetical protein